MTLLSPSSDVKSLDMNSAASHQTMHAFIAGMLSYQPERMTFLYRVHWVFVRLLGMKQSGIPRSTTMEAKDVSMTTGAAAYFFKVLAAEEERYWFAEAASESHLTAKLGVVVEEPAEANRRFHIITIVHYNSWAGPLYFNVIRPFHHIVVRKKNDASERTIYAKQDNSITFWNAVITPTNSRTNSLFVLHHERINHAI